MSNQEILEKAIQKAIDGGWRPINAWVGGKTKYEWRNSDYDGGYRIVCKKYIHEKDSEYFESEEQLIFNHDFAKALWGEEPEICSQCDRHHETSMDCDCGGWPVSAIKNWQYHLQQMVIAEDPIKYLGENL